MPAARRLAWLAAALLVAGCTAGPGPVLLSYQGEGCTEVGISLPLDGPASQALLPPGYAAVPARALLHDMPPGAALGVLAINACRFLMPAGPVEEAEAFAWLYVVPPQGQRLPGEGHHTWELARWRLPGPALEALRAVLGTAGAAAVEGWPPADPSPEAPFLVEVVPAAGGRLVLEGRAGPPEGLLDHPEGPCCRNFAPRAGGQGLVATTLVAGDQRHGTGPCTLEGSAAPLDRLLGPGPHRGVCTRNAPFSFQAEARAVP